MSESVSSYPLIPAFPVRWATLPGKLSITSFVHIWPNKGNTPQVERLSGYEPCCTRSEEQPLCKEPPQAFQSLWICPVVIVHAVTAANPDPAGVVGVHTSVPVTASHQRWCQHLSDFSDASFPVLFFTRPNVCFSDCVLPLNLVSWTLVTTCEVVFYVWRLTLSNQTRQDPRSPYSSIANVHFHFQTVFDFYSHFAVNVLWM